MSSALAPTHHPSPSQPRLRLPKGAWDTHCHVLGPAARFPFARGAQPRADAPKELLFALHAMLGIERCVIVQSSMHGMDNGVVADAIAAKGGSYLGVALAPATIGTAELKRLDGQGFRGLRFNFMHHLQRTATIDDVLALAPRLADVGWHLQIHMEGEFLPELGPRLAASPVPVVIDHLGRVDASLGLEQVPFRTLLRLMRNEQFWVKVSAPDRNTRLGPPYSDAAALAAKVVAEFPDRVLWGTDWPHPNHRGPVPDDGELVDLIAAMAPTPELQAKLMIANPHRFYDRRAAA